MSAPREIASETIVRLRSVPVERTPQRLDPLGVQSAWLLVPVIGVTAISYAIASTLWHAHQLRSPGLAIAGLVVLVLAIVVATIRTHPGLASFGRWSHITVVGLALAAACLFVAAVWGRNERIQNDWGQIVVALLLIAMPLYRPVLEVMIAAVVAAIVLGTLAVLQAGSLVIHTGPIVYATVAATPILALAVGGAGYAWTMIGETLRWRQVARAGRARLEGELRQTARRTVAHESAAVFDAETAPFLADVLRRGEISDVDRERAASIAARLRALAVSSVERTWLDETVALALAPRLPSSHDPADAVRDPDGLYRVLTEEQRAIVSAIVSTVAELPGLDASTVRVDVRSPEHPAFVLTARVHERRRAIRREIVPYLSALRSVAMETGLRVRAGELTLRFAYPGSNRS